MTSNAAVLLIGSQNLMKTAQQFFITDTETIKLGVRLLIVFAEEGLCLDFTLGSKVNRRRFVLCLLCF